MRYVLFGDESTLPAMRARLGGDVVGTVVAENRPSAHAVADGATRVQPPRKSAGYPEFRDWVKGLAPDLVICFSYSMLLGEDLLSIPRRGAINLHGGLLPQYRGANVLNWAIIEGAEEAGMSAHYMTPRIDDGDVIFQKSVPIAECDTALTLKRKLDAAGFELVDRIHAAARVGDALFGTPQDEARARHYRRRTPEDGLIDWRRPTREIFNLIRALVAPWPGAFYRDRDGHKIVVDGFLSLEEVEALRRTHGG